MALEQDDHQTGHDYHDLNGDGDDDNGKTHCWNLNTPSSLGSSRGSAVDNTWSNMIS